ncbi:MAG: hypothetical protein U0136_11115 [Bdellovibrionota bacterium]
MNTCIRQLVAVACLFGVAACNHRHEGPVERAGEKIDDAVDNVKDGQSPFHKKGVAERAGEAIDDATGGNRR